MKLGVNLDDFPRDGGTAFPYKPSHPQCDACDGKGQRLDGDGLRILCDVCNGAGFHMILHPGLTKIIDVTEHATSRAMQDFDGGVGEIACNYCGEKFSVTQDETVAEAEKELGPHELRYQIGRRAGLLARNKLIDLMIDHLQEQHPVEVLPRVPGFVNLTLLDGRAKSIRISLIDEVQPSIGDEPACTCLILSRGPVIAQDVVEFVEIFVTEPMIVVLERIRAASTELKEAT